MREILVIKPSSFGDIIHGLQVINEYRSQEKNLRITWIVRDAFASIVKACDAVDNVLIFERKGGVGPYLNLLKAIREKRYDYVIDLQGLARTAVWTFAAKGREKIGRSDAREAAGLAYSSLIPLPKNKNAHALEILLELLPLLGYPAKLNTRLTFSKAQPSASVQKMISANEPYMPITIQDTCCEKRDIPKVFQGTSRRTSGEADGAYIGYVTKPNPEVQQRGTLKDEGYILIFPDSRRKEKIWPYFYQLIEQFLLANKNYKIILAGSDDGQKYSTLPKERVANLIGKTEMVDLIPLIEKSSLVVTNDSGPMHLAAAMGANVLALFGPTSPLQFGPYPLHAPNHCILQAASPNMEELTVENVMETLNRALEKNYEFSQAIAKC